MDEIRVQSNHVTVNLPTRNTALASGASERLRRTPQRGSRSAIGRSGCPSTQSPSRNVERRDVLDNLAEGHSRARDPRFEAAKGIPIWSNTNWMEATQMSVLFFATRPPALSLSLSRVLSPGVDGRRYRAVFFWCDPLATVAMAIACAHRQRSAPFSVLACFGLQRWRQR